MKIKIIEHCNVFQLGYMVLRGTLNTLSHGKGTENRQECPAHRRTELSNTNQSYYHYMHFIT